MSELVLAVFENKALADSAYKTLDEYGYDLSLFFQNDSIESLDTDQIPQNIHVLSNHAQDNSKTIDEILNRTSEREYLIHKLSQGCSVIAINPDTDDWIAAVEIIRSFHGEILYDDRLLNLYEKQYQIDERFTVKMSAEVGTLGYPYDLLNDDAYIDPNIGIGNYDLLKPFMDPNQMDEGTQMER